MTRISRRVLLQQSLLASVVVVGCKSEDESGVSSRETGREGAEPRDGGLPVDSAAPEGPLSADGATESGVASDAGLAWSVLPAPLLVVGGSTPFDLAITLPQGVLPGGVFAVDPSGAPLPSGMTLSSAGLLAVGSATVGSTSGVVFSYVEP